jgi:glycosyltransferase involved in cell wall biosynthesis
MKTAIVTTYQNIVGGVQVFTRDISSILQKRGHKVDIVSIESLPKIPEKNLEKAVGEYFNGINKKKNYDVVLCNGEFGYSVEHPKAINILHGNYYGYAMSVKDLVPKEITEERLRRAELQKVATQGKYVVTVSESSKSQLEEFGIPVDRIIKNSVNTNLFFPRTDIDKGIHSLALARGRYYEKGFDVLKRLAEKGIKIRLFSDRNLDFSNVDNHGIISNEDLGIEYNKAQILFFPSRFEGGSLTVLEAMACGCPVMTTPTGYGYEIQNKIPNFVAEYFDEFIAKSLLVTNERERYSKEAIDYFWEFHNPEKFKKEWIEIVEGI